MLFSVEQVFVGREEIRSPLKTPAGEATFGSSRNTLSRRADLLSTEICIKLCTQSSRNISPS